MRWLILRLAAGELDGWIEKVKKCDYLPENDLKKLCEWVRSPTH